MLTLLTLAGVAFLQGNAALSGQSISGFGGMIVSDPMGLWLKCFAAIAMFVTLVYGRDYATSRDMLRAGDLFTLSLYALLGMFVMISGSNFLVVLLWVTASLVPSLHRLPVPFSPVAGDSEYTSNTSRPGCGASAGLS